MRLRPTRSWLTCRTTRTKSSSRSPGARRPARPTSRATTCSGRTIRVRGRISQATPTRPRRARRSSAKVPTPTRSGRWPRIARAPAPSLVGQGRWIRLRVAAAIAGALFFGVRRRSQAGSKPSPAAQTAKESEAIVEDVFLLNHKDGLLIKHETRRLRPDVDTDILSGMLTAVQAFVKDALRGDDYADLNEMTVGHMHILIGRGKWLVLAARIEGDGSQSWTSQIERCIKDMEDHHWDQIEDWDGDMGLARVLTPYIKKLIQGGYT